MPSGGARKGAGRKPRAQENEAALAQFIDALTPVKVGMNGYRRVDRYRDFNRVLTGSAAGKRVLSQIIALTEGPPVAEDELSNHALLAARAWSRRLGLMMTQWTMMPPPETAPEPETTTTTSKGE